MYTYRVYVYMIGVCTKLTTGRALACSAASGDEPGAGRRDCRWKLTVTLVSVQRTI